MGIYTEKRVAYIPTRRSTRSKVVTLSAGVGVGGGGRGRVGGGADKLS